MAGKIILVTGANRGIGFAIVQALLERSHDLTLLVASRAKANAESAIAQLQEGGAKGTFRAMTLDVSNDESVKQAVQEVQDNFGKLDVLINNAGIAGGPIEGSSDIRAVYNDIMDTNVTSVALASTLFLPLLRKSTEPRIINISSARGSLGRVTSGANPKTSKIPYSVSKVALNLLTIEMSNANPDVEFQVVNPGHCKTAFNGYRGAKDPLLGAFPAAELALAPTGQYPAMGFWEYENGAMGQVPW